jgi:phosphatidylglycerol:prolipoprotein diacylglycerol transferase
VRILVSHGDFHMTHVVSFPGLGLEFTVNEVALPLGEWLGFGDYSIRWYGILIAIGFLLGMAYAARSAKKMNIDASRLFDAVIVGLIGSVICARLYYVIFYPGDKYIKNPMEIFKIHDGGIALYGSLIGALVFGGLTAKLRKLRVPAVLDVASLGFLIGQTVGRWGNFVNQEAFGTPTMLPWGMASDNTGNIAVHPCFLYESLLCLAGFIMLHFFTRKWRRYDGQTFLLYIVWYGAVRFFIEGLRTDSLMLHMVELRVSQVVAAGCVVVGLILLFVFRRKTSLSGCGSPEVMEAVGLIKPEIDPALEKSTIFGELPEKEESAQEEEAEAEKEEKQEAPEDGEEKPEEPEEPEEPAKDEGIKEEKAGGEEASQEGETEKPEEKQDKKGKKEKKSRKKSKDK